MKKKLVAGLLVAAAFVWFAVKGIDFQEVRSAFRGIDYVPLIGVPFCIVATYFFRSLRWRTLLNPIRRIPLKELFMINTVGFMAIFFFPLRLGEFTRPLLLKQRHKIPFTTGLATIAVERVFDGLTALLALVIGFLGFSNSSLEIPYVGISIGTLLTGAALIVISVLLLLIIAVIRKEWAFRIVEKCARALPERLRQKVVQLVKHFFDGLIALPNARSLVLLFLQSCGVWGVMVVGYQLGLMAFHLDLSWSAPFSILGISAAGVSIPAAPGFVGTFQVFIEAALALYGIGKATGLAFSIVFHLFNLVYIVIAGLVCLPIVSTKMSTLYTEASLTQSQSTP